MIQEAIANAINLAFKILLDPSKIPLEIGYPKYDAHYTSAIALAIANRLNLNPLEIAEAIAQTCSQNLEISPQWRIQALGKGWLNIFLSERYLVESLFALENLPIEGIANYEGFWQRLISIDVAGKSPDLTVQYAYARCCALIRLSQQNNVGAIHELPLHYFEQFTSCLEPVEISLLMQNFAIADYLESLDSHKSRIKLPRSLAEAFLQFYDRCRILGVPQEIAVKRLLLIRVTQKLLIAIVPPDINYAMYL
jgi:arginyl-tRNA synthetase